MAFGRTSLGSSVGGSRATGSGAGGQRAMSDINVTPLVDVMLVLLVIFIITAPLMSSAIRLDLPKTQAEAPVTVPNFVTLSVDREGHLFLDDKAVAREALATALTDAARLHPDTEVQLRADQAVPYGRVAEVMAIANKAGLSRIGFVTEQPATPR